MRRAVKRAADLGVTYLTAHCGENRAMLEAAVENAGEELGISAVTMLTSVRGGDLRQAGFKSRLAANPADLVNQRALTVHEAGCAGVICSAREAKAIKAQFPAPFIAVTPGIRPGKHNDDQKRVMTPSRAILNGSDLLVVGRPIRDAPDPGAAADRITAEIGRALRKRNH